MLKQALTGTGLALGVTMLSAGQGFAASFNIDTFNTQFTEPYTNSQVASGVNKTILRTGTAFPTSSGSPATINSTPFTLPANQVIGGDRDLNMYSLRNAGNLNTSGTSRVIPSSSIGGFWQVTSSNNARVSSSMIWNNIDPLAPATQSNSGKFLERLNVGSIGFKTLDVITGSTNPLFQPVFTVTIRDISGNSASVVRNGIGSNQFTFIRFTDFTAANNLLNLNAVNYVELNVITGGGNSSTVRVDFIQGYEIPEPSLVLGLGTVIGFVFFSNSGKRARDD
ncbi:PEP-CTERM sorting domain-containing protein [Pannus brasiliensis CCIBt3594]|uniref:PEP-CTERM sorting domain-containing protein n=1 Tax=Pannus brasiliensis CCIBt3594 TaxID=1427578 RepID=A0AAW9QEF2_9CHRO